MKTTQYGRFLTQITRLGMMNCFLVLEDDGLTVVDTGMGGTAKDILKTAASLGSPIRRITLTHAHGDHVGSLDALRAQLPGAEVSIGVRDARFMAGDMTLEPSEQQHKLAGGFTKVTTQPDRLLHPGDRVGSLEVIASPGHTPGHISFFDTRDRTLIAGDAYTTKGGISTAGTYKLLFPLVAMATWSRTDGLRSAEALLALQPSRLAVGHGDTLENPASAMQKAIADAKRQIERK
jgi:glyoxylase-like metal-dependent hydrolase (beta-lactamase superfamily II)